MFTQDSSQVLKSQRGLPGSYFQVKEVPRDLSLLASETETETGLLLAILRYLLMDRLKRLSACRLELSKEAYSKLATLL